MDSGILFSACSVANRPQTPAPHSLCYIITAARLFWPMILDCCQDACKRYHGAVFESTRLTSSRRAPTFVEGDPRRLELNLPSSLAQAATGL